MRKTMLLQNTTHTNASVLDAFNETTAGNASSTNSTDDKSRYQLEYSLNYAVGLAILCFIGGIESTLILWTLCRSKRLRSSYYGFIGNLAAAQLIFCLVIGIAFGWLRIVQFAGDHSAKTTVLACALGMVPYHVAQVCGLLTRCTIGIDRLFAFSLPLDYRSRSNSYAPAFISFCWLWPIVEVLTYIGVNYDTLRNTEMLMCSGSGWKRGHFLTYTAYRDLSMGGVTVFVYFTAAALVTRKFVLLRLKGAGKFEVQSKPYQLRLLIASGLDAMIFTICNLMAYTVRTFIMMHLDGEHRLTANFTVGLLLASTNVTDLILYLAINRDFRCEFLAAMSPNGKIRTLSMSSNNTTVILHKSNRSDSRSTSIKSLLCARCS